VAQVEGWILGVPGQPVLDGDSIQHARPVRPGRRPYGCAILRGATAI
jgi:hypothetical protein